MSCEISDKSDQFREGVVTGLNREPKSIDSKFFYDRRGSELFDEICELEEYYPTRTELEIMQRFSAEMGHQIGPGVMLIEYGSGSSIKTRLLLDQLPEPIAYVPVDISGSHLIRVADQLQDDYPQIEVLPVVADFTMDFELPQSSRTPTHQAVYFPGSTIGNFDRSQAMQLLKSISRQCGNGGGLLIGIDLVKDRSVLELAYDDPAGVTAEFNLNLLHRMRNELDAELDLDAFRHESFYNEQHARIEMHIRSETRQTIRLGDHVFELEEGELIRTEYSHKYTVESFAKLAREAGLSLHKTWTDDKSYFAVLHLVVEP